jgi:hypothetical protein
LGGMGEDDGRHPERCGCFDRVFFHVRDEMSAPNSIFLT